MTGEVETDEFERKEVLGEGEDALKKNVKQKDTRSS